MAKIRLSQVDAINANIPPMLPDHVRNYLRARGMKGPWELKGCTDASFSGVVVIPALAEYENLFGTLRSLAVNPPEYLDRFLILVVVNHRKDACINDIENNGRTISHLETMDYGDTRLNIAWVDAVSPGLELPAKDGGVGMARKIGLDLALPHLDFSRSDPVLVSLDADTLVEPTYLPAIVSHYRQTGCGGAVIPFRHRPAVSAPGQEAIDRYELFLRSYVLGLSLAGSPYAFHTVGSAMASSAGAYIRMGGMNRRRAAEDFYFLQQLHRTAGVERLRGTTVHPSPRSSHRVPFGTGRSVARSLGGETGNDIFYSPDCFRILGAWLKAVAGNLQSPATDLMTAAEIISPCLQEFLRTSGFPGAWEKIMGNSRLETQLASAFHGWFDGLRTMKLIHHLSAALYPRCSHEEALPPLLAWRGCAIPDGLAARLELLRKIDNGES